MSRKLISSFNLSHQTIVDAIDQVQLTIRDYKQAKPRLREFNEVVLTHIGRQDPKFIERLYEITKENREQTKIVEFLEVDLKDIKIKFLLFSDQHSGVVSDTRARNFPRDFSEFARQILERIKVEEEYLFPILERIS